MACLPDQKGNRLGYRWGVSSYFLKGWHYRNQHEIAFSPHHRVRSSVPGFLQLQAFDSKQPRPRDVRGLARPVPGKRPV
jgi:hypothetical protein